ncbi:hypothetical protein CW354_05520 [Marinicaulis flavus]|uniref:Exonuclease domain-containing protein n=1 Tax=Hyphococcus luteus TaxID=2058213 RepID=A0A2S7K5P4_9PROT|nr:hypothetical protein CW354_05520 [Marinicaulis flavus]
MVSRCTAVSVLKDIAFIDLEASGLSARSWPIEVGWCFANGGVQAMLIKPAPEWSFDDWSAEAETLHGVSPEMLDKDGVEPKEACEKLNAALAGKIIYSDAPDWDGFWLYRLFQAGRKRQRFIVSDLASLLRSVPPDKIGPLVTAAELRAPRRHRAAPDVMHMRMLYELAASGY